MMRVKIHRHRESEYFIGDLSQAHGIGAVEVWVNTSHVRFVEENTSRAGCTLVFSDGKRLELSDAFHSIVAQINALA